MLQKKIATFTLVFLTHTVCWACTLQSQQKGSSCTCIFVNHIFILKGTHQSLIPYSTTTKNWRMTSQAWKSRLLALCNSPSVYTDYISDIGLGLEINFASPTWLTHISFQSPQIEFEERKTQKRSGTYRDCVPVRKAPK